MSNQGASSAVREQSPWLSAFDLHLFREGTHSRLYDKLGAHLVEQHGVAGVYFALWAPNARRVSVVGDFNGWDASAHLLVPQDSSGIWSGFVPGLSSGTAYQYQVVSGPQASRVGRMDPVGFRHEPAPANKSVVWALHHEWGDAGWMSSRGQRQRLDSPLAIYEVHLGSWMRVPEEGNRPLSYREIAPKLAGYARGLGFTHVELLPLMEHVLEGGHDYQLSGYFAPSSRYGTPQELMYLIDYLHQQQLGVILDWVPAHFPAGEPGLANFDGTHLYELGAWELALAQDGHGYTFDFGRAEVRSFLLSSACFWLEQYHADALRLDAVGAMLYLDFARKPGQWLPNSLGTRENLAGIEFVRQLNIELYRQFPEAQSMAEESSGWPLASAPTYEGGLGFGFKWDQGFVHDTLHYLSQEPEQRKFHHQDLTFRGLYAYSEHFVLPLSHELSGRGQGSLLGRMPGDEWQRFANLRLLLAYLYLQPGKKLLFMGHEFGQYAEWNPDRSLDWHLCAKAPHAALQWWVHDLNQLYRAEPALYRSDCNPAGFEWVDCQDAERSTLSWLRREPGASEVLLVVCNFTATVRRNFRVGVRRAGCWREVLNGDAKDYGGSGQGNFGGTSTIPFTSQGLPHTLTLTLPPLAAVVFKFEGPGS